MIFWIIVIFFFKKKKANEKRLKRLNARLERYMARPYVLPYEVFAYTHTHTHIYIYIY